MLKNLFSNDIFVMASLATILICIIFLVLLVILKNYKPAIFLAVISPFISAVFVSISGFQTEASEGSYIRVFILFFVGCIGFYQFYKLRKTSEYKLPLHIKLFALYLLLALFSTVYSIDPQITLIRSSTFIMFFGFLLGLYYWIDDISDYSAVMNTVYFGIITILMINMAVFVVKNDIVWYRGGVRFCGLWGHPNVFGMFAMVSYPVFLWKWQTRKYYKFAHPVIFILIMMTFHLLTGSRGSLLAALSGFSLWLIVQGKKVKLAFLMLSLCLLGFILVFEMDEIKVFKRKTVQGSTILTLTGRDEFWAAMKILIMEKPLTGYGYGVGGKIWEDPRFHKEGHLLWSGSARTSLHSGYLSAIINIGFLAFIIWMYVLFQPIIKINRFKSKDIKAPLIFIMASCFILNFIESLIGGGSGPASVLFWIAWIIVARFNDNPKLSLEST